jgi:hypothetical protein
MRDVDNQAFLQVRLSLVRMKKLCLLENAKGFSALKGLTRSIRRFGYLFFGMALAPPVGEEFQKS